MPETTPSDQPSETQSVVIERTFAVPAALVWKMWTEPEHFAAWYGPDGATVTVSEMEVSVGGARRITMEMQTPGGPMQMHFGGEHTTVEAPTRLSYTEAMTDAAGTVLPPSAMGQPDDHPVLTEITVELAEADGATTMVMTHAGIPADSPGAAGWRMALDKLAAAVAALG